MLPPRVTKNPGYDQMFETLFLESELFDNRVVTAFVVLFQVS